VPRSLSLPFDQCEAVDDWFVYPCTYTTKIHQKVSGQALQFCNGRNKSGERWKFSCVRATVEKDGKDGVRVQRVPMDFRRGKKLDDGQPVIIDGMAGVRAQQWERLAFVFESLVEHDDVIGALVELVPELKQHVSRVRAWYFGNGVITNEDEAIVALCEKAISA
jgi:hypothetical protein